MADGADDKIRSAFRWVFALAPPGTFLLIGGLLLWRTRLVLDGTNLITALSSIGVLALILVVSVAGAAAMRWVLLPSIGSLWNAGQPGDPGPGDGLRDHLAQNVVIIGTIAIVGTALAVIVALAIEHKAGEDLSPTLTSIFNSVTPVFSTWVGTVLAFYFSNKSFRDGANIGQKSDANADPITRPGTMIPYDRIVRHELLDAEMLAGGGDPKKAADLLKLSIFEEMFKPPGIVRVVIFDNQRHPIYVLRHELMPSRPKPDSNGVVPEQHVSDYMANPASHSAAVNFSNIATTATVDDGRRLLQLRRVTDIFVTAHGRQDEQTIGWVPDDNLNRYDTSATTSA
jgi:hypothetical protein